jgi:hypothetical protein
MKRDMRIEMSGLNTLNAQAWHEGARFTDPGHLGPLLLDWKFHTTTYFYELCKSNDNKGAAVS